MSSAEMKGSEENMHDNPRPNKGTEHAEIQGVTAAEGSSLADGNGQELHKSSNSGPFTLFGEVPFELRLIIWEMALPGPRCIQSTSMPYPAGELQFALKNYDKAPTILWVNQESRTFALQYHQAPVSKDGTRFQEVRYFNNTTDLLYHRPSRGPAPPDTVALISERFPHLSRLALDTFNFPPDPPSFMRSLTKLTCLEELVIVGWYEHMPPARGLWITAFDKGDRRIPAEFRESAMFWLKFEAIKNILAEMEKISTVGWKAPKMRMGYCIKVSY